ncbi:sensor histidine kinase/response regulator like protein [Zymoseptoria brevis]|uniref:histidine kinase n=1 Tax=Zymoseptoria brevis TaxID=1047168 RepID=A0A0F4G9H8_9PEZI|nr:sensor histidine kinase/response regulator like protein [Zymoseptoria brevis]
MSEARSPPSDTARADTSPRHGASRRDREFRRYAEAVVGLRRSAEGQAVSSRDLSLTAFAQLIALRLHAKRGIISLFDKERQYIIAEATRTLSLQQDAVHDVADEIQFGASVLERHDGDFYRKTLKGRFFEVNDLLGDEKYASHPLVTNTRYSARSYAGVPIKTPTGYTIGVLSFLDDRKRDGGLTHQEVTFMHDVAKTIMAHLEGCRTIVRHSRGIKMVTGLSRFVEGKAGAEEELEGSYRDTNDMRDRQAAQTSSLQASGRTNAMNAASNAERFDDYQRSYDPSSQSDPHGRSPYIGKVSEGLHARLLEETTSSVQGNSETAPQTLSNKSSFDPQDGISREKRSCFERAAGIINTSMNLAGTLFLDASVSGFTQLRNNTGDSTTSPESEGSNSGGLAAAVRTRSPNKFDQKPCRQIASAYDFTSTEENHVLHRPIPERFLKSLMRRYPYGKIWTLDANGHTSSDEFSESSAATDQTSVESDRPATTNKPAPKPKRKRAQPDGAVLAQLFPGVRSLALMPMYDSARERFFAGAVVWTYDPIRILSMQDDANYLGAFCDVIMAEVGRLDAQSEARAKTSFISSISHELRSPLHGILGGIEVLQDKDNAAVQEDMLQMIEASGKSLLDIVNHLLEHAHSSSEHSRSQKPNKAFRSREAGSVRPAITRYNTSSQHQPPHDIALLTEEVLDTALWSTPKPTPLSDKDRWRGSSDVGAGSAPIKVILEVEPNDLSDEAWLFRVNSGAWRRIVQNLTTNSLKYTDDGGYLKLSLSARPPDEDSVAKGKTVVELLVVDSGRGMSKSFLKFGLWQAFSQEDAQSQGTGLGLSLVHGIVKEMGGAIDVQSSKGVGTAIRVTIPLPRAPPARHLSSENDQPEPEMSTKDRLKHCTYTALGFGDDDGVGDRATQASGILRESIAVAFKSYGMRTTETGETAQLYIMPEHKAAQLARAEPQNDIERIACAKPAIVLCHSVASSRALANAGGHLTNAVHVAQPLGPRKLLKALTTCLEKLSYNASSGPEALQYDRSTAHEPSGPALIPHRVPSRPLIPSKRKTSDESNLPPLRHTRWPSSSSIQLSPTTPRPEVAASGLRTLLVDDNELNLSLLKTYMRRNGHDYTCARNGVEAVHAYKEAYSASTDSATPILVLMDLTMPIMGGLEATRQIRAFEREQVHNSDRGSRSTSNAGLPDEDMDSRSSLKGSHPPSAVVVALTAISGSETKMAAFGSGVDLYLTKPVGFKNLGEILKGLLEDSRRA